jgi:ATP-binding cassette subfamily F protein uup
LGEDLGRRDPGSSPSGGGGGRRPTEGARPAKLSYKDSRRLQELEALIPKLEGEIRAQEAALEDPGLYARDPKGFDRIMKALDAARSGLHAAETEWLELEEKREALGA